ncbi:MAG: MGMT family protein [Promethearchaeota archaeon]|nr:MAG: MGMT family protein [Candidatus Lokiarchaeota archaeon]
MCPRELTNISHLHPFTQAVLQVIYAIPAGKVQTYGGVARLAGNPRGARQVARILHSLSKKYHLPWHRVINSQGKISLDPTGAEEQRLLLITEDVSFLPSGKVKLDQHLWDGDGLFLI